MIYRLTGQARQELFEIWQYIAGDNERAADRLVDLLVHHFQVLGRHPYAGRSRDDLRKGIAASPWGST